MKKLLICFLLCLTMCSCLSPSTTDASTSDASTNSAASMPPVESKNDSNALFFVTDIHGTSQGFGSTSGFYFTQENQDVELSLNILYIDYATEKEVVLCNQPNCQHNTDTCTSLIINAIGGVYIFCNEANNSLYVIQKGQPEFANLKGAAALGKIYRMDMNGTNRSIVYTLSAQESFNSGSCIISDGEYVYYNRCTVSQTNQNVVNELVKVSLSNGQVTVLTTLTSEDSIYGIYNNQIIILNSKSSVAFEDITNFQQADDATKKYKQQLLFISTENGDTMQDSEEWLSGDKQIVIANNNIYTLDYSSGEVSVTDISTQKIFKFSNVLSEANFKYDKIEEIIDNHIIISRSAENNFTYYSFDCAALSNPPIELLLKYKFNTHELLVQTISDASDKFLVMNGITEHKTNIYGTDGTMYNINVPIPNYVLINKRDYWNSIPNYINIKNSY